MADSKTGQKGRFFSSLFLVSVSVLVCFSAAGGHFGTHLPFGAQPRRLAVFFAAFIISEVLGARGDRSGKTRPIETESWTFLFAMLLLAPSVFLIVAVGGVRTLVEIVRKKHTATAVFSGLSMVSSLGVGAIVLELFGLAQGLATISIFRHMDILGLIVAAGAIALMSGALRSVFWSSNRGSSLLLGLRREATETVLADSILLLLGVLVVALALEGWVFLPIAVGVAVAVQRGTQRSLESNRARSIDSLTNLPNRVWFESQIEAYVEEAIRRNLKFAVLLIDLDGFSEINDKLGVSVGDATLRAAGGRLEATKRPSDIVARLGGDEFGFLAFDIKSQHDIEAVAKRLRRKLNEPLDVIGCPVAVSGTIGVAIYPDHASSANELIRRSDVALFRAKRSRLGVVVYEGHREKFQAGRFSLLADLREAIGTEQLFLVYQPKVDLATNRVNGVEALLRWNHPKIGVIAPGEFMPLAEQTELMGPLTAWVLETALKQCAKWHLGGIKVGVAINGSAKNLHDLSFPAIVARALTIAGVAPEWLEIEITESTVMADPTRSKLVLEQLRDLGVAVSVDDFGSGYSSFTYLKNLPISTVKIDSSFVTSMNDDASGHAIVRAIIDLAKNLRLTTVAEGVETEDVLDSLRLLGCSMAQGYFILKPAGADEITRWLALESLRPSVRSDYFLI